MILYPAIDLKDGQCVRLLRGEMSEATVFGDDPAAQALKFQTAGCEWLHLVDLNGAFAGQPVNAAAVEATRCSHSHPADWNFSAWAAGSSPKTVASDISPRRRRTHWPSFRSMAG